MCGCSKGFLKFVSAHKRGAAVRCVLLAYGLRDGDPLVRLVQLLVCAGLAEDWVEVFGFQRLLGAGMQEGQRLVGHDGLDVKEMGGDFALREHEFFLFHGSFVLSVNKINKKGLL